MFCEMKEIPTLNIYILFDANDESPELISLLYSKNYERYYGDEIDISSNKIAYLGSFYLINESEIKNRFNAEKNKIEQLFNDNNLTLNYVIQKTECITKVFTNDHATIRNE